MERLIGHTELQELLGAYALDAVEPDETAAIERHLPSCPRCRNELAEHREVAALLGYVGGAAPSGVWDRIIANLDEAPPALRLTRADTVAAGVAATPADPPAEIADNDQSDPGEWQRWEPQTPPAVHTTEPDPGTDKVVAIGGRRRPKTFEMRFVAALAMAAAAAVIVAALGIEVGRLQAHKPGPATATLSALAYRVADADPNARHLLLKSPDGSFSVPAVEIADGTTYLGPGNLTTLPNDETYQMWGIVGGARVSLGVIGDNPTYASFTTPTVASVIAMTVEPQGGVVASTKTPVVEGIVPT